MPNRILREGILTSERVDALTSWASEVFYRRVISVVDDFGRYSANSSLLRAACYPLKIDKVSNADIGKWLSDCETAALISTYDSGGKRYLQVLDFRQQQRADKSKYPEPPTNAAQVRSERVAHADPPHTKAESESSAKTETITPPAWLDSALWADFLAMRLKIRKPPTEKAKGLVLKELEKLRAAGHDPAAVLEQSIRNSWQDVFPLREQKGSASPAKLNWKPGGEPNSVLKDAAAKLQVPKWMAGETHGQFRARILAEPGGEELLRPGRNA